MGDREQLARKGGRKRGHPGGKGNILLLRSTVSERQDVPFSFQRLLAIEAARALGECAISLFRTQAFSYIYRMSHPSVYDYNGARETGYKI
jgi:hypothetical protein